MSESPSRERRWPALAFVGLAQMMVALDATIISIALPSAQRALGVSDADRQWMITAYTRSPSADSSCLAGGLATGSTLLTSAPAATARPPAASIAATVS